MRRYAGRRVVINVSADIRAQFEAGAFRPLAISPAERGGYLPDIPTQKLDEAYVPGEFIGADAFRGRLDEIVRGYGPVAQELKGG